MDIENVLKNWNEYKGGEAVTDTTINPRDIAVNKYGAHYSYGQGDGTRRWRFENEKGYFRFIADYYDNLIRQ